ncbi:MAG: hypothetical protein ACFHXK_03110 [bacterium]
MVEVMFDVDAQFAYLSCTGELSLEQIVQAVRQWMQQEGYRPDVNLLCDARQAQWQHAATEFLQVSDAVVERINQAWQGTKIAVVANSHTEIALIESHLGIMGWRAQWRGFISVEDATQWLEEPAADVACGNPG